jgi:translation initiation factor IF-3
VRLIGPQGEQLGVTSIEDARNISSQKQLDLVLISENSTPPVCKLIDYGQFLYKQKKKEKQSKKTSQIIKEIKMSPKISDHDYTVRLNKSKKFLEKKYKIKVNIFFRGREIVHNELGFKLIQRFIGDISELGSAESEPQRNGRSIIVILAPK